MPHVNIKYSSDLKLDTRSMFKLVEEVINAHDSASGLAKGRAYPAVEFQHTHVLFEISMLTKPHRDQAFTDRLMADLENRLKAQISQDCMFSLGINYSGPYYITNSHKAG